MMYNKKVAIVKDQSVSKNIASVIRPNANVTSIANAIHAKIMMNP